MKRWRLKQDPITAAARSQLGNIPLYLLPSVGLILFVILVVSCRTDWSMVMPYYRLDSAAKVRAFDSGRGSLALMETGDLDTDGEEVVVTTNYTRELMIGGAVGPAGQSSSETAYQLYYRYFPDSSGGGALVVLAGRPGSLPASGKANVYKFPDNLVQSFFGSLDDEEPDGITLHLFRMTPHRYPVWAKYAGFLLFIALMVFTAAWLPGFAFVQKHCRIGRQIRKYGAFEQMKDQILRDYEQPLYASFKEFIGRRYLMLTQHVGKYKRTVWYFYPLSQTASVEAVPDPADSENCVQLRLAMKDGIQFCLYLYTTQAQAGELADSIRMYSRFS